MVQSTCQKCLLQVVVNILYGQKQKTSSLCQEHTKSVVGRCNDSFKAKDLWHFSDMIIDLKMSFRTSLQHEKWLFSKQCWVVTIIYCQTALLNDFTINRNTFELDYMVNFLIFKENVDFVWNFHAPCFFLDVMWFLVKSSHRKEGALSFGAAPSMARCLEAPVPRSRDVTSPEETCPRENTFSHCFFWKILKKEVEN